MLASELRVRFPRFVLGPLSFAVGPAQVAAVIGLNASGKTTLLRCIAGRVHGYDGSLVVAGAEPERDPVAVRARVGFQPDRVPAAPGFRARDYLSFVRRFHDGWDHAYAIELCRRLGIDGEARVETLSKGTRMKLGFIAAEAFRPPLLVLDEPTSGLDPRARRVFLDVVLEAVAGASRSVIFSTHILDDVHRLATTVLALAGGTLRTGIAPAEVETFIDPETPAHEHGAHAL